MLRDVSFMDETTVCSLFYFFLDLHVESRFAAGAKHRVLALVPRESEVVFAGGAFLVNVSFSVSALAFL